MIRHNNIFNEKTLNIFTDASMHKRYNEYLGAPGFIAVVGNNIVAKDTKILRESTNSESELYAIFMAIQFAIYNKDNFEIINIFSDSQFAVYGLREWIFKWINNIRDDKAYNSSNKEVACQSLFFNIIYTILSYNINIGLYHVRGHFRQDQISEFIDKFKQHNFLAENIDYETAKSIIYYNNEIDNLTRSVLRNTKGGLPPKLTMPEYLARNDIDINLYKKLLNI